MPDDIPIHSPLRKSTDLFWLGDVERKGIQAILKDEFLVRMVPYAVPEGVKILVPSTDVDNARKIVEDFIKDGASSDEQQRADKREATTDPISSGRIAPVPRWRFSLRQR